jgi:uncharacterized protein
MEGTMSEIDQSHMTDPTAYGAALEDFRRQKDEFFAASSDSPLPQHERQAGFSGLRYFPPDLAYRVQAEVMPFAQQELVQLTTSTGDLRPQLRFAELRFRLGGQELRLVGFADPRAHHTQELFIPFRDATSGHESYGAGRYLEVMLEHHANDTYSALLDFNQAYSPYCAYSPYYSCPVPPAENTLPVAIAAGERSYDDAH